jgi:hypothetical protein
MAFPILSMNEELGAVESRGRKKEGREGGGEGEKEGGIIASYVCMRYHQVDADSDDGQAACGPVRGAAQRPHPHQGKTRACVHACKCACVRVRVAVSALSVYV